MAIRIPVLEQAVDQAPLDTPRLAPAPDANDFGLGMIQQIGAGATDLSRAVVAQQSKLLEGDLLRADAELGDATGKFLIDTTTGEKAWRGRVAVGRHQDWLKAFDETAGRIKKGLSGRAKSAFDEIAARRRASYASTVQRYIAGENEAAYRQAAQSSIDVAANDFAMAARLKQPNLVRDGSDFDLVDAMDFDGMEKAKAEGLAKVKLSGGDEKQALDFTTGAISGAIGGLLAAGRVSDAKAVLDRYKDSGEISAEGLAKLEPVIAEATRKFQVTSGAAQLYSTHTNEFGETDLGAIYKTIGGLSDKSMADDMRNAVEKLQRDGEYSRQQTEGPIIDQIESSFRAGGRPQIDKKTGRAVFGDKVFSRTGTITIQKRWESYVRQQREGRGEGTAQNDADRRALHAFEALDLAGSTGADQISVQRANPIFDGVSQDGWNIILARQKARQRQVQDEGGVSRQIFRQKFDEAAIGAGYPRPKPKATGEKADTYNRLWSSASEKYDAWAADPAQNKGLKVPDPETVEKWIADEWAVMVNRRPVIWDVRKPRGALTAEDIESGEFEPEMPEPYTARPEQIAPDAVVFSPTAPKPGKVRVTDGNSIGTVDADKVDAFIEKQRRETGTEWRQL